jgi:rhomboid protease GluP
MTEQLNEKTKVDEKKFNKLLKNGKPVMTYSLIGINIFIYFIMIMFNLYNTFIYYGANNYLFVQSFEFHRLLTSMFLHANIYHIFFNMYALYLIGPQVEKYYGRGKLLLIYLLSGITGSIFSCAFMGANSIGIGASGAIFGLFGSLAYFTFKYRATLSNFLRSSILPTIFINLILGFLLPNVDNFAHLGGLISGIVLSIIVGLNDRTDKKMRINYLISFILMIIFMIYIIMIK